MVWSSMIFTPASSVALPALTSAAPTTLARYCADKAALPAGLSSCSKVYLTSLAVNGRPLWNFTPSRSLKRKPLPVGSGVQDTAKAGTAFPSGVIAVKPS